MNAVQLVYLVNFNSHTVTRRPIWICWIGPYFSASSHCPGKSLSIVPGKSIGTHNYPNFRDLICLLEEQ
jgi:hypothetical protein